MALTSSRVATSRGGRNDGLLENPQLPIAGTVRAGIQIMTAEAAKVPELREIYEQGVDAGVPFKDILARGQAHPKCPQRNGRPLWWLRPANVPYFTVRQADFPGIPGAADTIMDQHAEVREGDSEPRLYSFPVVFPTDVMDIVFREEFSEYNSTNERVHWSQMSTTDGRLKCVQYTPLRAEGKNARRQVFDARRQTEVRCDCEPDLCEFFGAGKCAHYGSLYFWIPCVQSEGVIRLTFKSTYTKLATYETLTRIQNHVLGRISGLYQGQPIFRISKQRQSVSRVNRERGTTERSDQWIVHLTAPGINVIEALSGKAEQPFLSGPADDDVAMLTHDDDESALEPEPEHERTTQPPPVVAELRAELDAVRRAIGLDVKTLQKYVEEHMADLGQFEDWTAALRNEAALRAFVQQLNEIKTGAYDVE